MKSVYWGRFNPPHKGHLKIIKKILKQSDQLIVAIGSGQEKNTKRNPFSGLERKKLMEAYLAENKINSDCVKVVVVNDGKSFSSSIKNLFDKCKSFDVLCTDKESIIALAEKKLRLKGLKEQAQYHPLKSETPSLMTRNGNTRQAFPLLAG